MFLPEEKDYFAPRSPPEKATDVLILIITASQTCSPPHLLNFSEFLFTAAYLRVWCRSEKKEKNKKKHKTSHGCHLALKDIAMAHTSHRTEPADDDKGHVRTEMSSFIVGKFRKAPFYRPYPICMHLHTQHKHKKPSNNSGFYLRRDDHSTVPAGWEVERGWGAARFFFFLFFFYLKR